MSVRLTTAVSIGKVARAVLRKTRTFPDTDFSDREAWPDLDHIGVEPMLLALSMELALKAWFVFDYDDPKFSRTHNLVKLFDSLLPGSQERLGAEFRTSVAPYYPSILIDYGIRDLLYQHQDAFIDWRYHHEIRKKKALSFEQAAFEATLEMVLREFEKRYYEVPSGPTFPA